jgi:hypothetical protein
LCAWLFKAAQKCIFCAKKVGFQKKKKRGVMEVAEEERKQDNIVKGKRRKPPPFLSFISLN